MNEEYNKVNVKLLSILAYIGPLFLMGKLSVEKEEDNVKFHTHQGAVLFGFVAGAYVITSLLCWQFLPGGARDFRPAVIYGYYCGMGDYGHYGCDRRGEKPAAPPAVCRRFRQAIKKITRPARGETSWMNPIRPQEAQKIKSHRPLRRAAPC